MFNHYAEPEDFALIRPQNKTSRKMKHPHQQSRMMYHAGFAPSVSPITKIELFLLVVIGFND